jgi:hypothetical protein
MRPRYFRQWVCACQLNASKLSKNSDTRMTRAENCPLFFQMGLWMTALHAMRNRYSPPHRFHIDILSPGCTICQTIQRSRDLFTTDSFPYSDGVPSGDECANQNAVQEKVDSDLTVPKFWGSLIGVAASGAGMKGCFQRQSSLKVTALSRYRKARKRSTTTDLPA